MWSREFPKIYTHVVYKSDLNEIAMRLRREGIHFSISRRVFSDLADLATAEKCSHVLLPYLVSSMEDED
jgi:hypothetical protein